MAKEEYSIELQEKDKNTGIGKIFFSGKIRRAVTLHNKHQNVWLIS